ncbi:MAG: rRNA synthase [Actinomycetota bacterium]|jgi:23S rRNA pseudouridine1911/1915/1917 synthase|nr:rRNA synthase [Actinomycetota bacterium]
MEPEVYVGEAGRLDAVLARLTGAARADIQRAIVAGDVTVNGVAKQKSFLLDGGERLEVRLGYSEALEPEPGGVPIRWQDEDLMVISKPAGLVTHPTENHRTGTLVNRLLAMDVPLSLVGGPLRPGIVHRLDAGTSGLMLVALTDRAHEAIQTMMRSHLVGRRYLALVRGHVENDLFAVDAPLGRKADRVVIDHTEGRDAETGFEVRERFENASLLDATPKTGRTHQIRVHLRAIGHPILGDRAYGGMGDDAKRLGLTRPFLHSWQLAFDHPLTAEPIHLEEPLPDDLATALIRVRDDAPDQQP